MAKCRLITLKYNTYSRAVSRERVGLHEPAKKTNFLVCPQCEKQCRVGQRIVTKRNVNRTRWYHQECADSLNITYEVS